MPEPKNEPRGAKDERPSANEWGQLRAFLARNGLSQAQIGAAVGDNINGRSRGDIAAALNAWLSGRDAGN